MARAASSASRRARSRSVGPRRGASAASAADRVSSSPIARAASRASRRAWSRSVGARRGASAASAWDRDPSFRSPAPPPAPRPGGPAPPGGGPARPAPADRVSLSPIARAASRASRRAWSRSVGARRGASAASAADRAPSCLDRPRRLQRLGRVAQLRQAGGQRGHAPVDRAAPVSDGPRRLQAPRGAGGSRSGGGPARPAASDRDPSSPMARAASSASRRAWSRSVGPRWGASAASALVRSSGSWICRA